MRTQTEPTHTEVAEWTQMWIDHNDESAARRLTEVLLPYVRGAAARFKLDKSSHEDLIQDAFLQIFRKLHTFVGNSRLQSWAYAVTRNEGLMRIRKQSRRPQTVELIQDIRRGVDEVSRLEARSRLRSIEQAFLEMPKEKVQALKLYTIEGFDIDQVAAQEGLSIAAAKSRVFRARRELSVRALATIS